MLCVILRTLLRFNPFCKPFVPGLFTFYSVAVLFSFLYVRDLIVCTFIVEYRELALSAWGFLLLLNFLESLMEACYKQNDKN